MSTEYPLLKTTVVREGRMTNAQQEALDELWPEFALNLDAVKAGTWVLEVGCGRGDHIVKAAALHPEYCFIAADLYRPGLGVLLQKLKQHELSNVFVYAGDVRVLLFELPHHVLTYVQIFFPDPWRKTRHHKRRLIQSSLIEQLLPVIKLSGTLHVATDWTSYADHIVKTLMPYADKLSFLHDLSSLAVKRYGHTAFECKAQKEGRHVQDFAWRKL